MDAAVAHAVPPPARRGLSPINRRRLDNFKRNRRGYWSFWIFMALFGLSLFADVIANDRPIVANYKGEWLFPVLIDYPEEKFGGFLARTDYRDPVIQEELEANGWAVWPPIRFRYDTIYRDHPGLVLRRDASGATACGGFPAPPTWWARDENICDPSPEKIERLRSFANYNWLGTDDQGRDVLARVIYGFRISVLFGLILAGISSVIGVLAGAVQGYYGGWTDLIFPARHRDLERDPLALPPHHHLGRDHAELLGAARHPAPVLLGVARGRGARRVPAARNFEYVRAARALGLSNATIMFRHLLPNAMVATLTFLPFILNGSITTLTSLDFLASACPPARPRSASSWRRANRTSRRHGSA
jgi:microcin C transport system permease protein